MWGKKSKWKLRVWVREPSASTGAMSCDLTDVYDDLNHAGKIANVIASDGFVDIPLSDKGAESHRFYPASSILMVDILKQ